MKAILYFVPILAALPGISIAAEPQTSTPDGPGIMMSIQNVDNGGWEITRGMTAKTVISRLGQPALKIAPDVWIYVGYDAVQKERSFVTPFGYRRVVRDFRWHSAEQQELRPNLICDRLVVTLADNKVVDIHLANCRAVAIITKHGGRLPKAAGATVASTR